MSKIKIKGKEYHYDKKNPNYFLESIGNDFYDDYVDDFEDLIVNENEIESVKVKTYKGTIYLGITDEYIRIWNNVLKKIRGIKVESESAPVNEEVIVPKTQSKGLRNNEKQHKPKNTKSNKQEKRIKVVANRVLEEMRNRYPGKEFMWDSIYYLKPLLNELKERNPNYRFFDRLKERTHIRPDGGLVSWIHNGIKRIILISEQKQQGTNDERILEGLDSQAKGNTIERVASPFIVTMMMFSDEDINPYIVWCQGCDFHESSPIFDRGVRTFALQQPNQINLYKETLGDLRIGGSIFMDGNDMNNTSRFEWDENFMFETMLEIADKSMQYYITKYGE
jgi:type II restriction enzyme